MVTNGEIHETFYTHLPEDTLCTISSGTPGGGGMPKRGVSVEDPAFGPYFMIVFKIRAAIGGDVAGFAAQVEEFIPARAEGGAFCTRAHWTITLHGRGTISFDSIDNKSDGAAQAIMPALESGTAWQGEWSILSTVGPAEDRRGVIVGGTGEFYGATGTARKVVTLKRIDPASDEMISMVEEAHLFYTVSEPEPQVIIASGVRTEAGSPQGTVVP